MKFKSLEGKRLKDNKLIALLKNASGPWADWFKQTTIKRTLQALPPTNLNEIQSETSWLPWCLAELIELILLPIHIWPNKEPLYIKTVNLTILLLSFNIFESPISLKRKEPSTKQGPCPKMLLYPALNSFSPGQNYPFEQSLPTIKRTE